MICICLDEWQCNFLPKSSNWLCQVPAVRQDHWLAKKVYFQSN